MGRANYGECLDALQRREAFEGNSMHAIRYDSGAYYVYSYSTLILQDDVDPDGDRVVYFDNRYFSHTTSRHQSLIRQAFPETTEGSNERRVYER